MAAIFSWEHSPSHVRASYVVPSVFSYKLMLWLYLSVGASGGYIAGKRSIIAALRLKNHSSVYAESMSPPVIQQIISSLTLILGRERQRNLDVLSEGEERLRRLAFNARYLSSALRKLGFIVYGDRDSPIIPLLIFHPGKVSLSTSSLFFFFFGRVM